MLPKIIKMFENLIIVKIGAFENFKLSGTQFQLKMKPLGTKMSFLRTLFLGEKMHLWELSFAKMWPLGTQFLIEKIALQEVSFSTNVPFGNLVLNEKQIPTFFKLICQSFFQQFINLSQKYLRNFKMSQNEKLLEDFLLHFKTFFVFLKIE